MWAATQRGHDHDIADYEIYLWEVGSPAERAVRLTYHSGNDRWPDIFIPGAGAPRAVAPAESDDQPAKAAAASEPAAKSTPAEDESGGREPDKKPKRKRQRR